VCTLGLNAEKVDLSAGAGAGDSTPEIGALTVPLANESKGTLQILLEEGGDRL